MQRTASTQVALPEDTMSTTSQCQTKTQQQLQLPFLSSKTQGVKLCFEAADPLCQPASAAPEGKQALS